MKSRRRARCIFTFRIDGCAPFHCTAGTFSYGVSVKVTRLVQWKLPNVPWYAGFTEATRSHGQNKPYSNYSIAVSHEYILLCFDINFAWRIILSLHKKITIVNNVNCYINLCDFNYAISFPRNYWSFPAMACLRGGRMAAASVQPRLHDKIAEIARKDPGNEDKTIPLRN